MKLLILLLLTLLNPAILPGQSISGFVKDFDNGSPLSYCNISIAGTYRGTTSNLEGYYRLKLDPGTYQILFQYMGYKSKSVDIQIHEQDINLNIELHPQVLPFNGVTVYADQKSEIECLILKASQQKRKSLKFIRNYFCNSYTKTSFRAGLKNVKAYGGIFEIYSKLYFNAPDKWHEAILSQKQTSNIPQSVNLLSGNTFLDINSDRIHLGKKNLVGPIAPDAIEYYSYKMADTLFQDNHKIFKIDFSPRKNNIPSMSGTIFIVDKFFVIKQIDAQLNAACNYDVFENIHIIQKYKTINDSLFLPDYSFRESNFVLDIPKLPPMIVKKENYRENYLLNNDANIIHPELSAVVIKNTLPFDSLSMLIPPLNMDESQAYVTIDSMIHHNKKLLVMTNIFKLLDTYAWLRLQPIGEFSDFFRFNRVEGFFAGLSINTHDHLKPLSLKTGYGYGLSDKKSKYFITPRLSLPHKNMASGLGLNVYDKIETREDCRKYPIWLNTSSGMFKSFDYFDYYYSRGFNLNADFSINQFMFAVDFINEMQTTAVQHVNHGVVKHDRFIVNPHFSTGQNTGLTWKFKYSNIIYHESSIEKKLIPNQKFWEMEFSVQSGIREWGSDFDYTKYFFQFFLRQNLTQKGFLDLTLLLGSGSRNLPEQFLFELESGFAGYRRYKAFATLDQNVFTGPKKCALYLEHNSHDSIFRLFRLPIPWEFSIICNSGWAGDKNYNQIRYDDFYSEFGFGLNKIMNLFKFEFIWSAKRIPKSDAFCLNFKIDELDIF